MMIFAPSAVAVAMLFVCQSVAAQEPAPEPETFDVSAAPGKGFTIKGKSFSVSMRPRVQIRYQLIVPPENAYGNREQDQQVSIGTLRLYTQGHLWKPELTYLIQLAVAARDYRDSSTSPIYDAYLDWRPHRDFNLRAGQFFVPFDRLRTVREFALQIPDRARPITELTLDRDVGISFYSDHFLADASPLTWRVSVFGGGGNNLATSKEPGGLVVGRLELRPLGPIDDDADGDLERRARPGLAIGAGFAQNWNTDRTRSTTGARFVNGNTDFTHATADIAFKWRGFALQAEYLYRKASADELVAVNTSGVATTEYTRSGQAWVAQASYHFETPFEVVARASRLYTFAGTDPRFVTEVNALGQEVGGGLNYYVNGHRFKFQSAYLARMPTNWSFKRAEHTVIVVFDGMF